MKRADFVFQEQILQETGDDFPEGGDASTEDS